MTKQKVETYLATLNASCDWTTLQLDDALLHDQGGEEEADTKLSGHGGGCGTPFKNKQPAVICAPQKMHNF